MVLVPVVLAFFVAALLDPLVLWLTRRRWPRIGAAWFAVILLVAALAALVFFTAPQIAAQTDELRSAFTDAWTNIKQSIDSATLPVSSQDIEAFAEEAVSGLRARGSFASGILRRAVTAVEVVAGAILTVVLTFFFVKDGPSMSRWIIDQLPPRRRSVVASAASRIWTTSRAYMGGVVVIAAIDALLVGVVLTLVGVPLVLPLSALTFVGGFFPLIGAFTAGLVAVAVALGTGGVGDALLVAGGITAVQQLEGNILQPIVMGRAVKLHPTVVMVALGAGSVVAGIVGAFTAVPFAAAVAAAAPEFRRSHHTE